MLAHPLLWHKMSDDGSLSSPRRLIVVRRHALVLFMYRKANPSRQILIDFGSCWAGNFSG